MPYKSESQRKFFNSPAGKEKICEEEVEKWNEESKKQKNLPEKVSSKDRWNKSIKSCDFRSAKTLIGNHVVASCSSMINLLTSIRNNAASDPDENRLKRVYESLIKANDIISKL